MRARLRQSATTYGPRGRVVATLVVVSPMWLMWELKGPYDCTILGLATYPFLLWPALKDIWRPVRDEPLADPGDDAATVRLPSEPLTDRNRAIATRESPPRW